MLVVILHTLGGSQSPNRFVRFIGHVVKGGWSGVTMFFILSGFLITGILLDSKGREGWIKNFYIRRVLRIFPLYYGALLVVLANAIATHHTALCLSRIWVFVVYLQNTSPFANLTSGYGSTLGLSHFWSLAVEEQFYLIWPFFISRTKTLRQVKLLCVFTFLVSFCFRLIRHAYFPENGVLDEHTLMRAGELATGGFLAVCYRDESWRKVNRWAPAVAAVSLSATIAFSFADGSFSLRSLLFFTYGVACVTILFACLLVLSLRAEGVVSKAMNMAWLRWVGGISFGIYVFHVLLAPVFRWVTSVIWPTASRTEDILTNALVTAVMSVSIAWLSFRYLESPFLKMRKKFSSGRAEFTVTA